MGTPSIRSAAWGEARDWRGYDPYDALNSPLAPYLTLGTAFGRRALTQAVKRSPVNLRPLLRIKPARNAKAIGLVASGYARLAGRARRRGRRATQARRWLEWLVADSTADDRAGLGLPLRRPDALLRLPSGTPNMIATRFVAHALLDGLELLGEPELGDAAREAAALPPRRACSTATTATPFFRYLPEERELVHNANLLGCSVVVRTARAHGTSRSTRASRRPWRRASRRSARTARGRTRRAERARLGRQLPHGLRARGARTLRGARSMVCDPALERGFDYWERELFLPTATPKYHARAPLPDRCAQLCAGDRDLALRPGLARRRARPRLSARPSCWWRACSTRAGHVGFQRGRFVDEPRAVRPLDDRARVPCARADSSWPRSIGDEGLDRPRELAARAAVRARRARAASERETRSC